MKKALVVVLLLGLAVVSGVSGYGWYSAHTTIATLRAKNMQLTSRLDQFQTALMFVNARWMDSKVEAIRVDVDGSIEKDSVIVYFDRNDRLMLIRRDGTYTAINAKTGREARLFRPSYFGESFPSLHNVPTPEWKLSGN